MRSWGPVPATEIMPKTISFPLNLTVLLVHRSKYDVCKIYVLLNFDLICDKSNEGKSYTFKNPETKFKMYKDLSCNSKNLVYKIECSMCKEIYIVSTQAHNTRTLPHMNNIKITENRKLNISKHLYECSAGLF